MIIEIKAAFPIEWGREYYTVEKQEKTVRAPCICCDNTGKVEIKGVTYECPRCKGNWRKKEVVGAKAVYSVAKWALESVTAETGGRIKMQFKRTNSKERYTSSLVIKEREFHDMTAIRSTAEATKMYSNRKDVIDEVKRLNAEEKKRVGMDRADFSRTCKGCASLTEETMGTRKLSAPMIKCKKTPKKKCSFVAERREKR